MAETLEGREGCGETGQAMPGDARIGAGEKDGLPLAPAAVLSALDRHVTSDDVLVVDGGEFGQWGRGWAAGTPCRAMIHNGKLGAIGGSIAQGVGASLALTARVWALVGDGGFGYGAAELDTAAREGADLVVVVGNDSRWGTEWHHQVERYGADRTVGTSLASREYETVARGYGAVGLGARTMPELRAALGQVEHGRGVYCINAAIMSVPWRNQN